MAGPKGSIISATALAPDSVETQNGSIPETNRRGGPKTVAGKRRSSLNRLGSGLYSNTAVTRGEDKDEYLRFARAIVADLDVQTALEMACAERIVSALWRARRARRYEQAHLNQAADVAEQRRERLHRAEQELARHERDTEAARRLSNCERMTAKELKFAASALSGVFWREVRDAELPDEFWVAFPDHGHIARKSVARIAEVVREIFKPVYVAEDSHAFWAWVGEKRGDAATWLRHERDEAGSEYAKALRQTFLLDPTCGDAFSAELRAGRVLHDAERRLDRQVTQALADLEGARRLRP
jgi:hypothetical protein